MMLETAVVLPSIYTEQVIQSEKGIYNTADNILIILLISEVDST